MIRIEKRRNGKVSQKEAVFRGYIMMYVSGIYQA
ncbi:hypothetical protein IMSAGC012_00860 [Lachnospiraceae bacterium]|nr:hypothetical protein IMSAGC012_00860 [Lachnospiraceae bacterium]